MLEQLVANNDKLTTTNKELVDIVKKFQQKMRISNERPTASRKSMAAGALKRRGAQPFAPIEKRKTIMRLMPVVNYQKARTSTGLVGKIWL